MASIIMKRGTTSEISNTPISDGQILFETDTKNIYIDKGSNRIEYRATTIDIDSALSTTSKNPVQNKVVTTNINTTKANLGDVTSLTTTDKSSVVGAVNEINSNLTTVESTTHPVTINSVNFGTLIETKVGKVVTITFSGNGNFTNIISGKTYTICTLSNKPLAGLFFLGIINSGVGNQSYASMNINNTNRSINFILPDKLDSSRTLHFSCTYLCE